MAKGKKGKKRGGSKKSSSKSRKGGGGSKRGMPGWAKFALVLAGGMAIGAVSDAAGFTGDNVNGTALGIAAASVVGYGAKVPPATVIGAVVAIEGVHLAMKNKKVQDAVLKLANAASSSTGATTMPKKTSSGLALPSAGQVQSTVSDVMDFEKNAAQIASAAAVLLA